MPSREKRPTGEVKENDGPEDELVGEFAIFVPQNVLGEQSARPAAEEFEKVKSRFRNAPTVLAGCVFVEGVGEERDDTDPDIGGRNPRIGASFGP
jgi:hypothetical protein